MPTPEEVLAQYNEEYAAAPKSMRWQPPDGDYTEFIQKVEVTTRTDGAPQIAIIGTIASGDYEGKDNLLGRFGTKNFGMLKDVVDVLGGDDTLPILSAVEYLRGKIGEAVLVRVSTTTKRDTGQTFRNANIVGYQPIMDEAPADDSPDGDPGPASEEATE